MNKIYKLIIKHLYENLRKLRLKCLIGVVGSVSFDESTVLYANGRVILSDLDVIVILTPISYAKYLVLRIFYKGYFESLAKANIKGLKVSISYENPLISWLFGTINYINLFELKIIAPKELLLRKSLTFPMTQIPLVNIFELFISCLADILRICSVNRVDENYRSRTIAKRLKFLGYIYCLVHRLNFLNTHRNRAMCLELLKSQLKGDYIIDIKNLDYDKLDLLIDFFTRVFAENILRLKIDNASNNKSVIIKAIIVKYLNIISQKKKFLRLLASSLKYILGRSVQNLADLRLHIKYGYSLHDFLRLAVLIFAKRILGKEFINKNTISSLCYLWEKVMM
ncbi:MAG: hypothetical protein QW096_11095 [Thermofilaceae archaeon]